MASIEQLQDWPAAGALPCEPAAPAPRFDRIARLYRILEYLSFGPLLERCRFHHLPAFRNARRALVLGDGDGRSLARLLTVAPKLHADAVDISPAMLHLLRHRVAGLGALSRLTTTCADVRSLEPPSTGYDLVASHFFLDCLTDGEVDRLIARLRPQLAANAQWLVSEFQVPSGSRLRAGLARAVISFLYAAFRVLTGLRVRRIPTWRASLARQGFACVASRSWLGGLLVSERWKTVERQPRVFPRAPTLQ